MNKKNAMLGNLLMDYHWSFIRLCRNRARRLIDAGVPCSDRRLVNLTNRILRHGIRLSRIWRGPRSGVLPAFTEDIGDKVTA